MVSAHVGRHMNLPCTRNCTLLLLALLMTLSCAGGDQWLSGPTRVTASTVLLVAGDIGMCGSKAAIETGLMLDSLEGTILAVGDLAYRHGTAEDVATCYHPAGGRPKARTKPSLVTTSTILPARSRTSTTSVLWPAHPDWVTTAFAREIGSCSH